MSSYLHFLESIKILLLLFGICPFDISTKSGLKIETRPIHIVMIVAVILANMVAFFTIAVDRLGSHRLFDHGLSGAVLFSVALIMAASSFLLMLFSLTNRRNQISLLRKIDAFDRRMREHVTFHIDCRKLRIDFISHVFVSCLYEVLLFLTQVTFKYNTYESTQLFLFFVFYSVSDVFFSAHIAYVTMYGKYLINRYGILNRDLKIILRTKRRPIRKRFTSLMSLYEKLFQLQLLVVECFGSILLFTIGFHVTTITVSLYVVVKDIWTHFDRFGYFLVTYGTWMLPYFIRILHIATTSATIESQVGWKKVRAKNTSPFIDCLDSLEGKNSMTFTITTRFE